MLIIHNAQVYTQDKQTPRATALAIDHSRILAVGEDDQILASYPNQNLLNASGRTILPGLVDAHLHLADYALGLKKIDCEDCSRDECLERVALRVISAPPGEWILGHGWNQNNWDEGYGTASLLDEIAPNNPVYLTHKSLHCAWVNTPALHLAGITSNTPDPSGGVISRDESGMPDGILFESAMGLLEQVLPEPSPSQLVDALASAIPQLWRMGLTGVHDFDDMRCYDALQVLKQRDGLKFRVHKGFHPKDLPRLIELKRQHALGDDLLQLGPLKMFSDGALGPHTAAMLEPYEDDPDSCGMLLLDATAVFERGQLAIEHGFNLAIHAIGDLANRQVLDGYTRLRQFEHSLPDQGRVRLRHRIEHVQVLDPHDFPRFQALDIIASMQPIHATSDMLMADHCWGARSVNAYAWQSLLNHHACLIFGSDAPVESPNPFLGLYAAVTRRRPDGNASAAAV
jgi:hypothetical protein